MEFVQGEWWYGIVVISWKLIQIVVREVDGVVFFGITVEFLVEGCKNVGDGLAFILALTVVIDHAWRQIFCSSGFDTTDLFQVFVFSEGVVNFCPSLHSFDCADLFSNCFAESASSCGVFIVCFASLLNKVGQGSVGFWPDGFVLWLWCLQLFEGRLDGCFDLFALQF